MLSVVRCPVRGRNPGVGARLGGTPAAARDESAKIVWDPQGRGEGVRDTHTSGCRRCRAACQELPAAPEVLSGRWPEWGGRVHLMEAALATGWPG